MVRAAIKEASELQRKDRVNDTDRTAQRDECADWIERNVVDGERSWNDWTMTAIGNQGGWSRQHVAATIDAYFEPASAPGRDGSELFDALGGVDVEGGEGYRAGLRDGFREGVAFALENGELLSRLAADDEPPEVID